MGILNPIDALQKRIFISPMILRILHMLICFHDIMFFDAPFSFSHTHTEAVSKNFSIRGEPCKASKCIDTVVAMRTVTPLPL